MNADQKEIYHTQSSGVIREIGDDVLTVRGPILIRIKFPAISRDYCDAV